MALIRYSSLIRTFNSELTLPGTLKSLSSQTMPPNEYVFVDLGSTDRTVNQMPEGSIIHRFDEAEFNYSEALN